jgi:hypothetical protein
MRHASQCEDGKSTFEEGSAVIFAFLPFGDSHSFQFDYPTALVPTSEFHIHQNHAISTFSVDSRLSGMFAGTFTRKDVLWCPLEFAGITHSL